MATLGAGLAGFILLRFLMGISQCGNYSAGIKALAGLFPAATRSRAGGVFNAGAQLGSVIAPPIVVFLASQFGWRMAFVIPALLGLLWLIPWLTMFPDKATMTAVATKPAGASSARALPLTLGQLIGNHKVLGLFLIRVFTGPITTFYWTWLPLYLRTGRGMSFLAVGFFASVPNLIGMGGNVVGGLITDRLVKVTGSVDRGRKIAFACAFSLGALSMTMPFVSNDYLAVLLMGLALFGNQWVSADVHRDRRGRGSSADRRTRQRHSRPRGQRRGAAGSAVYGGDCRQLWMDARVLRRGPAPVHGDAEPFPRAAPDRTSEVRSRPYPGRTVKHLTRRTKCAGATDSTTIAGSALLSPSLHQLQLCSIGAGA